MWNFNLTLQINFASLSSMDKNRGYLISFEGGEGAGKTSQVVILCKKLKKVGYDVVAVREPGGNKIAEQIREVVLDKENKAIMDRTELLLYMAARAQVYNDIVRPALEKGKIILMDRTRDSSVVYQGMMRGLGEKNVEWLNDFATDSVKPDLTFLLDVPVRIGLSRLEEEKMNRMDLISKKFHELVRKGYLDLAERNDGRRWQIVDGTLPMDEVTNIIWSIISKKLPEKN
ncbi:MAG: dTMP kinase [Pseudomonadales bacterium]|jgi:dTMP kinase|nr:dTMP kinase [Pseudomonadales bacterium]